MSHPLQPGDDWVRIGVVGVDSGQLLLTDPCYIGSQWADDDAAPRLASMYQHEDGTTLFCSLHGVCDVEDAIPFRTYEEEIPKYGKTANQLNEEGKLSPIQPPEPTGEFSYNGCCDMTLSEQQAGQLNFELGHAGAGVVVSTGFGDGLYDVFARYRDIPDWGRRITEVRVVFVDPSDD